MAKTRVKNIDDSKIEKTSAVSHQPSDKKPTLRAQGKDELVEKLRAELGIEEKKPSEPVISKQSAKSQDKEEISLGQKPDRDGKKAKKAAPKTKTKPRSKKYQEAAALVDKNVSYPLKEAVELAKKVSYSKYDGTFEIHLSTNVKNIRGLVSLPYASGKKVKIIAFGKGAEESGADLVGDEAALSEIAKGKINFDFLLTTPEWMPRMAGLAKILGPRGLMPNPKNGTIGTDLKKMVDEIQSGKLEYKTESNGKVMHLALGKVSQSSDELSQNVKILISTIGKTKIKRATLAPTLGPGVKLDLSSI